LKEDPETVIYISLYKKEKLILHPNSSIFAKKSCATYLRSLPTWYSMICFTWGQCPY